jgi:hypothetical protein
MEAGQVAQVAQVVQVVLQVWTRNKQNKLRGP